MINKLGGTRAILAYMFSLALIAACFYSGIASDKFAILGTITSNVIMFYFSNKATKDKPIAE